MKYYRSSGNNYRSSARQFNQSHRTIQTMAFKKGEQANKKGTMGYSAAKRALADKFVRGLMHDFSEHGDKVIAIVREKNPDVWLRLMAQLIPQTLEIETAEPMTLDQAIQECTSFLIQLPEDSYQLVMQAVTAERQHKIAETPDIDDTVRH